MVVKPAFIYINIKCMIHTYVLCIITHLLANFKYFKPFSYLVYIYYVSNLMEVPINNILIQKSSSTRWNENISIPCQIREYHRGSCFFSMVILPFNNNGKVYCVFLFFICSLLSQKSMK